MQSDILTDVTVLYCGTSQTDIYSLSVMMYEMAHMDKDVAPPQMMLFKIIRQEVRSNKRHYSGLKIF